MQRQQNFIQIKGMQRDFGEHLAPGTFAYENENIRFTPSKENTLLTMCNERGPLLKSITWDKEFYSDVEESYGIDYINGIPIGQSVLNDNLVLFTTSDFDDVTDINPDDLGNKDLNPDGDSSDFDVDKESDDRIYKFWFNVDENKNYELNGKLIYKGDLSFNPRYPIETLSYYENESVKKVYWTDGLNQGRLINIEADKQTFNKWRYDSFDFVRNLQFKENVTINKVYGKGSFAPCVIQYACTYVSKYAQESNIFYTSPMFYTSTMDSTYERGGNPDGDNMSCAFDITINNVDHRFDYVRLYCVYRTSLEGTPQVKYITDLNIDDSSETITYTDLGTIGTFEASTALLFLGGEDIVFYTMSQKDNTMFVGNYRLKRPVITTDIKKELQDIFIKSNTWSYNDVGISNFDKNSDYHFDCTLDKDSWSNKGFMRDEWYRFGVQFQYINGKWSEAVYLGDIKPNVTTHKSDLLISNKSNKPLNSTNILDPYVYTDVSFTKIQNAYLDLIIGSNGKSVLSQIYNLGYRAVRPVIVLPPKSTRRVICQGVVNPTIYNQGFRNDGTCYAQPSPFFRPDTTENMMALGVDCEFRHNYPVGTYIPHYSSIDFNSMPELDKTDNDFPFLTYSDVTSYDTARKSRMCLFQCKNIEVQGMDVLPTDGNYIYRRIDSEGGGKYYWGQKATYSGSQKYYDTNLLYGSYIRDNDADLDDDSKFDKTLMGFDFDKYYYVDRSIVTLNAPELEFDSEITSLPSDVKFRLVGIIPINGSHTKTVLEASNIFTSQLLDGSSQTYKPHGFYDVYEDSTTTIKTFNTFTRYSFTEPNINPFTIDYIRRRIISAPYWIDTLYDMNGWPWKGHGGGSILDPDVDVAIRVYGFSVYPFQRTNYLGNANYIPTNEQKPSSFKKKVTTTQLYSICSDYDILDCDSEGNGTKKFYNRRNNDVFGYTLSSLNNGTIDDFDISGVSIINSDEPQSVFLNKKDVLSENILYKPQIDQLITYTHNHFNYAINEIALSLEDKSLYNPNSRDGRTYYYGNQGCIMDAIPGDGVSSTKSSLFNIFTGWLGGVRYMYRFFTSMNGGVSQSSPTSVDPYMQQNDYFDITSIPSGAIHHNIFPAICTNNGFVFTTPDKYKNIELCRFNDSYGWNLIDNGGKLTDDIKNSMLTGLAVPIKYKSNNHIVINFNMSRSSGHNAYKEYLLPSLYSVQMGETQFTQERYTHLVSGSMYVSNGIHGCNAPYNRISMPFADILDGNNQTEVYPIIHHEIYDNYENNWMSHIAKCFSPVVDDTTASEYSVSSNSHLPGSYLWLGELYRDADASAVFGGTSESQILDNTWTVSGPAVNIDLTASQIEIKWYEGDTFFQRYDCMKTYPYSYDDAVQNTEILSFMVETRKNIEGRYDRNRNNTANFLSLTPENTNMLNEVYSQSNDYFTYKSVNSDLAVVDYFPNQITWSEVKVPGSLVDAWTNITLAAFLDLDGDKGCIEAIRRLSNELYSFQDKGVSRILYNEKFQVATQDMTPIQIQNSGKVDGKEYISNHVGCHNKWSIIDYPNGLLFIDDYTKNMYMIDIKDPRSVSNMSDKLLMGSWFKYTLNGISIWNPVDFGNFVGYYDKLNDDAYEITNETAISYNASDATSVYTSFYSYDGASYFSNILDKGIWVRRPNGGDKYKLWSHHDGEYNMFFGVYKPYSITLLANEMPNVDKTFDTIDYRDDEFVFNSTNESYVYSPNTSFDKIYAWTEYQTTNQSLVFKQNAITNLKKKFRIWRAIIPRASRGDGKSTIHGNRIRNPWMYIKLAREDENTNMIKAHDFTVNYFDYDTSPSNDASKLKSVQNALQAPRSKDD